MMRDYGKNKKQSAIELRANNRAVKAAVLQVEEERTRVLKGNSTSIGKHAIDVMRAIEQRGKGHKLHKDPVKGSGIPKMEKRNFDAGETSVFRRLPLKGLPEPPK